MKERRDIDDWVVRHWQRKVREVSERDYRCDGGDKAGEELWESVTPIPAALCLPYYEVEIEDERNELVFCNLCGQCWE